MPSSEENRKTISAECQGHTFLGVLNLFATCFPKIPWNSRPHVMAEIRRWMALVSFNKTHRVKDCEELLRVFNIGMHDAKYPLEVAGKLRASLMKIMREEELPRLMRHGVVRKEGDWDPRARFLWMMDDWNHECISDKDLDKFFPKLQGLHSERTLGDVAQNEATYRAKYLSSKALFEGVATQHSALFERFESDYKARGWDHGDELLARLFKEHEQTVGEYMVRFQAMLRDYRGWQCQRVNLLTWERTLHAGGDPKPAVDEQQEP